MTICHSMVIYYFIYIYLAKQKYVKLIVEAGFNRFRRGCPQSNLHCYHACRQWHYLDIGGIGSEHSFCKLAWTMVIWIGSKNGNYAVINFITLEDIYNTHFFPYLVVICHFLSVGFMPSCIVVFCHIFTISVAVQVPTGANKLNKKKKKSQNLVKIIAK